MFCHKCGSQIADGASFCHKCGAKMSSADTTVQTPTTSAASEPRAASISTKQKQPQTHDVPSGTPKKKKSMKLPIILGVIALAFVVIIIAVNFDDIQERGEQARRDEEYIASQQQSAAITLSETYTNESEGFSFSYPSELKFNDMVDYGVEDASGFSCLYLLANDVSASPYTQMVVLKNSNPQFVKSVFSDDSKFLTMFKYNFDAYLELETSIGQLDGRPVRLISYVQNLASEVAQAYSYQVYIYVNNSTLYQVIFACPNDEIENQEKIFNAIMDSYTITAADTSGENVSESVTVGEILYKDIPVSSFFDTLAIDVAYAVGLPEGTDRDDDIRLYILPERGEVESAEVWNTSALTVDGIPLNKNREGLIDILGEPSEEGGETGSYSMTYNLPYCSLYFELGETDSEAWRISISPNNDIAASTVPQDNGTVSFTDLLGTWQWQGNDIADAALGTGGAHQLTLYSNGTCNGEIATSDDKDFGFVMALSPDNWSFLEYEQILQVSTMTTGWDWDSNGSPIEVPVYKTMNFKVSISGNTLRLENVENPNSKNVEYIKVG